MNIVAKAALNNSVTNIKAVLTPSNQTGPKIDWDNFNYPPLLKVIHYDISEVSPEKKLIVRALWLSHVLIMVESILNIINTIAIAAVLGSPIRIMYSFMFLFSFNPLAWYLHLTFN